MNDQKHKRNLGECLNFLNTNGIAVDNQLKTLIEFFFSVDNHVSLDDMRSLVKAGNLDIPDKVILDAFSLLVEYGFAIEKVFGDNTLRYEHLHLGEHHDHFYCMKCGSIIEFYSPVIEDSQMQEARSRGFHVFSHKMQILGLCERCYGLPEKFSHPLTMVESGGKFRISAIAGRSQGCNSQMKHRLLDMGMAPGVPGEVITNHGGRLVLFVNGTRIALGRGMSQNILVTLID